MKNKLSTEELKDLRTFAQKLSKYRLLDLSGNFKRCTYIIPADQIKNIPLSNILVFEPHIVTPHNNLGKFKYIGFLWSNPFEFVKKTWINTRGRIKPFKEAIENYNKEASKSHHLFMLHQQNLKEFLQTNKNV